MRYTETNLRNAWENVREIGKFQGVPVYAISYADFAHGNYNPDMYHVVFDRDNLLIHGGEALGHIKFNGDIVWFPAPRDIIDFLDEETIRGTSAEHEGLDEDQLLKWATDDSWIKALELNVD